MTYIGIQYLNDRYVRLDLYGVQWGNFEASFIQRIKKRYNNLRFIFSFEVRISQYSFQIVVHQIFGLALFVLQIKFLNFAFTLFDQ